MRLLGANGPPDEPHTCLPNPFRNKWITSKTNKQPRAVYAAGLKDIPVPRDLLYKQEGRSELPIITALLMQILHAYITPGTASQSFR